MNPNGEAGTTRLLTFDSRVMGETSSGRCTFDGRMNGTELYMRSLCLAGFAALLAAGPAMGQVIIQTPNGDTTRHEQRAAQDRADAHFENQEARRRAAVGDYAGAALTYPWEFYYPAGLLVVLVLAINLVGDGLRDAFDPNAELPTR